MNHIFDKAWNWSLSPMTFSINLPSVFKSMIGLNIFGMLYKGLLGLEMIINVDVLKYDGQYPNLKHMLAMSINLSRHSEFLMISLICCYDNLFSPRVELLLYLSIAKKNSCFEKGGHSEWGLSRILSIRLLLTCQYCAKLNVSWRACQRSLISRHRLPLYLIASIVESFLFFTQFINSHRSFLLFKISWILLSKNSHLEVLTILLKIFQSFRSLEFLYVSRAIWQLLFYHKFEYLVILTNFKYLNHVLFVLLAKSCIITSRSSLLLT